MSAWGDIKDLIDLPAEASDAAGQTARSMSILAAFAESLTDWHTWASLGWAALGLGLTVLGLVIWFRKPIESAAGSVASVAKLAAA